MVKQPEKTLPGRIDPSFLSDIRQLEGEGLLTLPGWLEAMEEHLGRVIGKN